MVGARHLQPIAFVGFDGVAPDVEVLSVGDIAALLDVAVPTAHRYANRNDFPEPLGQVAGHRVWARDAVEAWAKRTLPLRPGRPPKDD